MKIDNYGRDMRFFRRLFGILSLSLYYDRESVEHLRMLKYLDLTHSPVDFS